MSHCYIVKYDCILNRRILPNPNGNFSFSKQLSSFRISFVVISTEHYCILQGKKMKQHISRQL